MKTLNIVEDIKILSTTDYTKFNKVKGNRELNTRHLAALTVSIMTNNRLKFHPIEVTPNEKDEDKLDVIDGQHRLEVAKNNDLKIYYIVAPKGSIEEIIRLNSVNRAWLIRDYLDSYASRGNNNYIWLLKFMDDYALPYSACLILAFGKSSSTLNSSLKLGKFTISDEIREKTQERADVLSDIRQFIDQKGSIPKYFLVELSKRIDQGLGKKLVKNIQARGKGFKPKTSIMEASLQLDDFLK